MILEEMKNGRLSNRLLPSPNSYGSSVKAHNETRAQNCHWPRQGARVFLAGGTNFFVKIIQHRNASGTQKYRVPSPSSAKNTHDESRAQLCSWK